MPNYIMVKHTSDGFGTQYHAHITCIAVAKYLNLIYVYLPFKKLGHADEKQNKYDAKMSEFVNLNNLQNIVNYEDVKTLNSIFVTSVNDIISDKTSDNTIFIVRQCQISYVNCNLSLYSDMIDDIRRVYFDGSTLFTDITSKFIKEKINIVVHVRGGDILTLIRQRHRIISDEKYLKIIDHLRNEHNNCYFHIITESNARINDNRNLNNYKCDDTMLYIDTELRSVFNAMVNADILVVSKSSLSYVAGLLNTKIVYYNEFWLPGLNHWKRW